MVNAVVTILLAAAMTLLAGAGWWVVPKYWRGHPTLDTVPARVALPSLRRTVVASTLAVTILAASVWLYIILGDDSTIALWVANVFLVVLLLDVMVILLNRPAGLVPPKYRDEPGLVALKMQQRRARHVLGGEFIHVTLRPADADEELTPRIDDDTGFLVCAARRTEGPHEGFDVDSTVLFNCGADRAVRKIILAEPPGSWVETTFPVASPASCETQVMAVDPHVLALKSLRQRVRVEQCRDLVRICLDADVSGELVRLADAVTGTIRDGRLRAITVRVAGAGS